MYNSYNFPLKCIKDHIKVQLTMKINTFILSVSVTSQLTNETVFVICLSKDSFTKHL